MRATCAGDELVPNKKTLKTWDIRRTITREARFVVHNARCEHTSQSTPYRARAAMDFRPKHHSAVRRSGLRCFPARAGGCRAKAAARRSVSA
jgi:hypothetical protein